MGARYAAVLFDLFGTLVEFDQATIPQIVVRGEVVRSTLPRWEGAFRELVPHVATDVFWQALADVSGEMERERHTTHVERPSRERFRRALLRVGCAAAVADEAAPVLARAHMRCIADATRVPPAHTELLDAVRAAGRRVAIVSNFDDTATLCDILERHGLRARTDTVVASEAVGLRKPHPILVRLALRDLGVDAGAALMVGDSFPDDVGVARAAGIDAAWIDRRATGVPDGATPPRYVVRALTDLAPVVG